ncbi:hypothetical protein EJ110_NYTH13460 [Nymphaea thermarum]|nr:hypothetical protein EJ110_NYTH13460 [Nymphaea thermarum]
MLVLAVNGSFANLIVYLIQQFNVDRITAAQILNVFNGSTNITPVIGAIVSDSFLGAFMVVLISSLISFMVKAHPGHGPGGPRSPSAPADHSAQLMKEQDD